MSMSAAECWNCAGSGAVPSQGSEPAQDVDGGFVVCPTCTGSGRLGVPPTAGQWAAWCDADKRSPFWDADESFMVLHDDR